MTFDPWNRVEFDSRPIPAYCCVCTRDGRLDEAEIKIFIRGKANGLAVIRFVDSFVGRTVRVQHPHFQSFAMHTIRLVSRSPVVSGRDALGEPCDIIIVEVRRA